MYFKHTQLYHMTHLCTAGVVTGLTLQSQLLRIVWEAPIVTCNAVSYYTVAMTTYSEGTLIETGTTTLQNYTLTKSYGNCCALGNPIIHSSSPSPPVTEAGVPYNVSVQAVFGGAQNTTVQVVVYSQELGKYKLGRRDVLSQRTMTSGILISL